MPGPTARTDPERPLQKCRRLACRNGVEPTRPWHVYCSASCRAREFERHYGAWPWREARTRMLKAPLRSRRRHAREET